MASNADKVVQEIRDRYQKRTANSKAHHEKAVKYLPGGDTRAVTFFQPYPLYTVRGEGCYLYDVDGNEYIDVINNFTSLIHGHACPPVVEAIQEQSEKGTVLGSPGEIQYRHAEYLCNRIESVESLRYCNSGTEATMFSIRAARAFTGKDAIIKMDGGYHGGHDFAEVNIFPDAENPSNPAQRRRLGSPASVLQDAIIAPYNDLEAMERLLEANHEKVAGIITEPIMGASGLIPAQEGYLKGLRELADRYGVLLIFDEVMAFRLGWGGCQEQAGVKPDITALGKIIGGGLPVGAFGGRKEIMDRFDPTRSEFIWHSGTFSASNIVLAAGMATLENYEKPEVDRLNALGDKLRKGFNDALADAGLKGQATGFGSLAQVHWTDEPFTNAGARARAISANPTAPLLLHMEMMNRGVYAASRGAFCLSTPMTGETVEKILEEFKGALETLEPCFNGE